MHVFKRAKKPISRRSPRWAWHDFLTIPSPPFWKTLGNKLPSTLFCRPSQMKLPLDKHCPPHLRRTARLRTIDDTVWYKTALTSDKTPMRRHNRPVHQQKRNNRFACKISCSVQVAKLVRPTTLKRDWLGFASTVVLTYFPKSADRAHRRCIFGQRAFLLFKSRNWAMQLYLLAITKIWLYDRNFIGHIFAKRWPKHQKNRTTKTHKPELNRLQPHEEQDVTWTSCKIDRMDTAQRVQWLEPWLRGSPTWRVSCVVL